MPRQLGDVCFSNRAVEVKRIPTVHGSMLMSIATAMVGGVVPPIDSVVEYVEEISKGGRLRAVNVRPI